MANINETKKYLDQQGLQIVWDAAKQKFVTTKLTDGAGSKSLIFNEIDGGGAKFEHEDGTWSFTGVNNGGKDGIAAQVYAVNSKDGYKGSKLDVTVNGIYYTKGDTSAYPASERDVRANELVVQSDLASISGGMRFIGIGELGTQTVDDAIRKVYQDAGIDYDTRKPGDTVIIRSTDKDTQYICDSSEARAFVPIGDRGIYATKAELTAEEARAMGVEALKLNIMPGDEHTGGNAYNLPYYFYTVPSADKISVHTKTVTLDGTATHGDYSLDVTAATSSSAGLMSASDKSKLDEIDTLTEAEILEICV